MIRTTADRVKSVLLGEYDAKVAPDLTPFLEVASADVDDVVTFGSAKGQTLPAARLEQIERWLAAHYYQMADPGYKNRSTAGASGAFNGGGDGDGYESTRFGRMAVNLDTTNVLRNKDKQQIAGGFWLGQTLPEQTDYDDRN